MRHLLPQGVPFFKASLHTHSTVSDGQLTPQEVKAQYKQQGYQILSLTDHHLIAAHPELNDPEFLTLTGIEIGMETPDYAPPQSFFGDAYHFNLIAKHPDTLWQPYPPTQKYAAKNPERVTHIRWDESQRICSVECANEFIRRANEEGFLVIYNHPTWSGQNYLQYSRLEGVWALEIRNTHNVLNGFDDNNARVYRDMLNLGRRLCVVAADDTHRPHTVGGSWTMIGAKTLTYDAVIEAMEKGDLYATCGPLIHSLTLDGNILRLCCTPAAQVALQTQARFARRCAGDGPITQAEFDISDWLTKSAGNPNAYFRLTVTAPDGTYADTRAYWLDEL